MIRRGFWLTAGAVTGIYGYRRVSAIGRRLSGRLNPAGPAQQAQQAQQAQPAQPAQLGRPVQQAWAAQHAQLAQQGRPVGEAALAQGARLARRGSRGAIGVALGTYRFTRDVREGMELYMARHSAPAGSTLGAREPETLGARDPEPGRNFGPARDLRTNDDPRPKDGH